MADVNKEIFVSLLEPEERKRIDRFASLISLPRTKVGEAEWTNSLNQSVFRQGYPQLRHIFAGLVSLVEIEAMGS